MTPSRLQDPFVPIMSGKEFLPFGSWNLVLYYL